MKIQILVDNPKSWAVPYAEELRKSLSYEATIIHNHEEVIEGDILILLSCEKIFKQYDKNKYNIVVHASDLPSGKGWSPLIWQILEGKKRIPITLFEAANKVDAGDYYIKDFIQLDGNELIDESRHKMALKINEMVVNFIENCDSFPPQKQTGEESFYQKRNSDSSELDINKTIAEQFNILRTSDNERFPAYFIKDGKKFILKIYKG